MTTTTTRRFLVVAAATAALAGSLLGAAAQAQTTNSTPAAATAASAVAPSMAPQGAQLTVGDIYQRMQAAGMHAIREIEWDKGRYEVKARNAQGEAVKLYVNGSTGAIEHTRVYRK